jgi:hypothetical protein
LNLLFKADPATHFDLYLEVAHAYMDLSQHIKAIEVLNRLTDENTVHIN